MGTNTRPELSRKNKYWLEKHRYYELKHFCLQYPLWRQSYAELDGFRKSTALTQAFYESSDISDPTGRVAETLVYLSDRIDMVEKAAVLTDEFFAPYILKAVTEELSFDKLRALTNIPCGKDAYYELYRKFFWLLNKARK